MSNFICAVCGKRGVPNEDWRITEKGEPVHARCHFDNQCVEAENALREVGKTLGPFPEFLFNKAIEDAKKDNMLFSLKKGFSGDSPPVWIVAFLYKSRGKESSYKCSLYGFTTEDDLFSHVNLYMCHSWEQVGGRAIDIFFFKNGIPVKATFPRSIEVGDSMIFNKTDTFPKWTKKDEAKYKKVVKPKKELAHGKGR